MKNLKVTNFGPVRNIDIELRDINIFIGEQSIGKSTIAKLITIFTDYVSLMKLTLGGYETWEMQLDEYNLGVYKQHPYSIFYQQEEDNCSINIKIENSSFLMTVVKNGQKITSDNDIIAELFQLKKIHHDSFNDELRKLLSLEDKQACGRQILELMNNSLYVPAERIIYSTISKLMPALTIAKSSVPTILLRFMVELMNAKNEYPEFEIPLLNISYKWKNDTDYFVIGENGELPLTAASSGIQSTVPLLLVLHYAIHKREFTSFVLEEPECNLFPEKQVELLKHIIALIKSENRTLTITTHSPYLLSDLNNYLYAGSLIEKYGDRIRASVESVISESLCIKPCECAVFSLGERINENQAYCKSLLDEESGMIDFNSLDNVSIQMGEEFEALENAYIEMLREENNNGFQCN